MQNSISSANTCYFNLSYLILIACYLCYCAISPSPTIYTAFQCYLCYFTFLLIEYRPPVFLITTLSLLTIKLNACDCYSGGVLGVFNNGVVGYTTTEWQNFFVSHVISEGIRTCCLVTRGIQKLSYVPRAFPIPVKVYNIYVGHNSRIPTGKKMVTSCLLYVHV